MQSLVEDIASAVTVQRNNLNGAIMAQDKYRARIAIRAINAKLGDDYKIIFDTPMANENTPIIKYIKCDKCKYETKLKNVKSFYKPYIKKYTRSSNSFKSFNHKYIKCEKCDNDILYSKHNIIETIIDNTKGPIYFRQPPRIDNIIDESFTTYDYWQWVEDVYEILERQHQRYRAEISQRNQEENIVENAA